MTNNTIDSAREVVYRRWRDLWVSGGQPRTPYAFENEDARTLDAGSVPWARVSVKNHNGGQDTLGRAGERKFWRPIRIYVQLFHPLNSGMKASGLDAAAAQAIFEASSFDGVHVFDMPVEEQPVLPKDKWLQTLLSGDAAFEEQK